MNNEPYTCTSLIVPVNEPNYSIYREMQQIKQYLSPKKNATPCEIRRKILEIFLENKPEEKAKNSSDIYNLIVDDKTIDEKYRINLTEYRTRGIIGNIVNRMSFIGGSTEKGYYFKENKYSTDDKSDMLEFVQKYTCT